MLCCCLGFSATAQQKRNLTLDDIFKSRSYYARGSGNLRSMADGEHYVALKHDSLNVYAYETGTLSRTLTTADDLIYPPDSTAVEMDDFELSPDEKKILFATGTEAIYRRSSRSDYFLFDTGKGELKKVSGKGKQQLAMFSPDSRKIAFVRDNNLFICFIETGEERQVTFDGEAGKIINGAPDWVYEEEFEFARAFDWSADGNCLAYYRFDETHVREYVLIDYDTTYPDILKYKYPKAGEDNSIVTIHLYNLRSGETATVDVGDDTDIYIPRLKWTKDPGILSLIRLNRHQNKLDLLFSDLVGSTRVIYTEENRRYININDDLTFLDDNRGFMFTSEKSGFRRIYWYDMTGTLVRIYHDKNCDVLGDLVIDQPNRRLYFATNESGPYNKELFTVSFDGNDYKLLSEKTGYNSARFSRHCKYYVNNWSDANTPPVISVHRPDGSKVRVVEENAKLRRQLELVHFPEKQLFKFRTSEGVDLYGWKMFPPQMKKKQKYPVLFSIYGGPGSQSVLNAWAGGDLWERMLADTGIIVISVDNRGTGGRGEEFEKCVYMQLGKFETIDQVETARHISAWSNVDKNRIGIFGWSYGGFLAASCMTIGADFFSTGIAVAPVTNFRYYDNIYTERYMRKPIENESGYDENAPVNHAAEMKGKLLLVHGVSDDNVHVQNSMEMINALVDANKHFELMMYPNSNHGIYTGDNTRYHLFSQMTSFLAKNLLK